MTIIVVCSLGDIIFPNVTGCNVYWGQLINAKASKDFSCKRRDCTEPIIKGENYIGLVIQRKGAGAKFTNRLHEACFLRYLRAETAVRREAIIKKRKERLALFGGNRSLRLDPELALRRRRLLQYVSVTKRQLQNAYISGSPNRIMKAKLNLARKLRELAEEGMGPEHKFEFGPELTSLIQTGADSKISMTDIQLCEGLNVRVAELLERELPGTEFVWHNKELDQDLEGFRTDIKLGLETHNLKLLQSTFEDFSAWLGSINPSYHVTFGEEISNLINSGSYDIQPIQIWASANGSPELLQVVVARQLNIWARHQRAIQC